MDVALPERQLRELALFAGAGGGILGGKLLGWKCVCAVEIDPYCQKVLLARQRDGILEPFPIWDDIKTFDGRPWQGSVDVVSGGFPCQDISCAGKGKGIGKGERSGLWSEMARIIGEVQPKYVLVENSPMLTLRGLDRVLGDLATMGYDARWGVLGACCVGAPHLRERIWIIAYPKQTCHHKSMGKCGVQVGRKVKLHLPYNGKKEIGCETWFKLVLDGFGVAPSQWRGELLRDNDGVADGLDRLAALGNGQVPHCMALAWTILRGEFKE
jgi:DNA (cytosine-5)-methyltransferase 1